MRHPLVAFMFVIASILFGISGGPACPQKSIADTSAKVCASNMRRIADAQIKHQRKSSDQRYAAHVEDLLPYLGALPKCPNGGRYSIAQGGKQNGPAASTALPFGRLSILCGYAGHSDNSVDMDSEHDWGDFRAASAALCFQRLREIVRSAAQRRKREPEAFKPGAIVTPSAYVPYSANCPTGPHGYGLGLSNQFTRRSTGEKAVLGMLTAFCGIREHPNYVEGEDEAPTIPMTPVEVRCQMNLLRLGLAQLDFWGSTNTFTPNKLWDLKRFCGPIPDCPGGGLYRLVFASGSETSQNGLLLPEGHPIFLCTVPGHGRLAMDIDGKDSDMARTSVKSWTCLHNQRRLVYAYIKAGRRTELPARSITLGSLDRHLWTLPICPYGGQYDITISPLLDAKHPVAPLFTGAVLIGCNKHGKADVSDYVSAYESNRDR